MPVHVILGVSDYTKIKMHDRLRIGQPGDPIAELTRFGWFIMSPGHESNLTHLLFSNTSAQDGEKLCSLDVLGIKESHSLKDTRIQDRFKKQLKQSNEGWYETVLIWKIDHPVLTNNKSNSLVRLKIRFPLEKCKATKRDILKKLASIYDPLGFVSPVHLMGKIIYRMICEKKLAWDNTIPSDIMKVWDQWESSLIQKIEIPRSIVQSNGVTKMSLHVLCDSSKIGYCAVGYIVCSSQGLIAIKSRLAKQNTTIPRLELIASQVASKLAQNFKEAFSNYNIREILGWTDSTVVLHWFSGNGEYK